MALIVENGTQVANANSYASVEDADVRMTVRPGGAAWVSLNNADKESALISATDFMLQRYRLLWAGYRVSQTQSLDWPRYQVPFIDGPGEYSPFESFYPANTVPKEVVNATIDLALKVSKGEDLMPDQLPPVIEETVGPITTKYDKNARASTLFVAVDKLLSPLLKAGGSIYMIPLARG